MVNGESVGVDYLARHCLKAEGTLSSGHDDHSNAAGGRTPANLA